MYMCIHRSCAGPTQARRGCQVPGAGVKGNRKPLTRALLTELSCGRAAVLLTTEHLPNPLIFLLLRQGLPMKPGWRLYLYPQFCTSHHRFCLNTSHVVSEGDVCSWSAGYRYNCPFSKLLLTVQWEITDFWLKKQCLGLETSKGLWSPFVRGIQTR